MDENIFWMVRLRNILHGTIDLVIVVTDAVVMGRKGGVESYVLKDLFMTGCTFHLIHLVAPKELIPVN